MKTRLLLLCAAFTILIGGAGCFKMKNPNDPKQLLKDLESGKKLLTQNAIARLGQIKYEEAGEKIIPFLTNQEPLLRLQAAKALGDLKESKAIPQLLKSLEDPDPNTQLWVVWALGNMRAPEAEQPLRQKMFKEIEVGKVMGNTKTELIAEIQKAIDRIQRKDIKMREQEKAAHS